jgi:hypothetical protein
VGIEITINLDKVVVTMTTSVHIAQAPMHMAHLTILEAEVIAVQEVIVPNLVKKMTL